jgi:hypothetical protein
MKSYVINEVGLLKMTKSQRMKEESKKRKSEERSRTERF